MRSGCARRSSAATASSGGRGCEEGPMADQPPKTTVIAFPFDLFGNAGTGAGAERLADFVGELLADNRAETRRTRCDTYRGLVKVKDIPLTTPRAVQTWRSVGRHAVRHALRAGERVVWL